MPIEASGGEWFEFAYGDDWYTHAEFFATDHAKVLLHHNTELDPVRREQQAADLAQDSRCASANDRSLIIELLVPASNADRAAVGGDLDLYDDELRPDHTVSVIQYLQDRGVAPAICKIEGLDRHDDAVTIAKVAKRDGRSANCIVIGRHAPHDKLDRWLQNEARRRICEAYLEFANYYVDSRAGSLIGQLDPEIW